eukprot:5571500-Pyramimonas_sp.AAC.1
MVVNQITFVRAMLTSGGRLGPLCTDRLGNFGGLSDSLDAHPPDSWFPSMIGCLRLLFVV